jgi:uncharacterized protein (DUF302 family)
MSISNGIVTVPNKFSVSESLQRLGALVKSRGLTVFAHIFSVDAAKAGLRMPATQLLIFGNPESGTPLMMASPIADSLILKSEWLMK